MCICLIFNQISEALFPRSINESSEFITIQYIIFDEYLVYFDAKISMDSIFVNLSEVLSLVARASVGYY